MICDLECFFPSDCFKEGLLKKDVWGHQSLSCRHAALSASRLVSQHFSIQVISHSVFFEALTANLHTNNDRSILFTSSYVKQFRLFSHTIVFKSLDILKIQIKIDMCTVYLIMSSYRWKWPSYGNNEVQKWEWVQSKAGVKFSKAMIYSFLIFLLLFLLNFTLNESSNYFCPLIHTPTDLEYWWN